MIETLRDLLQKGLKIVRDEIRDREHTIGQCMAEMREGVSTLDSGSTAIALNEERLAWLHRYRRLLETLE